MPAAGSTGWCDGTSAAGEGSLLDSVVLYSLSTMGGVRGAAFLGGGLWEVLTLGRLSRLLFGLWELEDFLR